MKRGVAAVVNAIVMAASFVVELAHVAVALVSAAVTLPLELVFAVPLIGRLARQLVCVAAEIVWRVAGLPDLLLGALGVLPEKKLRLQIVIQRDENGEPIATPARALIDLQAVIDVFMDAARVRVLPLRWATFSTPFSERESADERFVRTASKPAGAALLDVVCGASAWLRDMGTTGSAYSLGMSKLGFWGALRRLLGYGAPLTAYVVRDIKNAVGCSLGPLTDYVTVVLAAGDDTTLFHELGHSCGLLDGGKAGTIMACAGPCGRTMSKVQALIVRNSRHVTYL